jgi:hypothetical protein
LKLLRNLEPLFVKTLIRPDLFKLAVLAGACMLLTACKPAQVAAPVAPQPVVVAGPSDEASQELPKDLFPGMPMYPGLQIVHVRKPKGAMREILFSSDGQMPQMVAYYKDGLKKGDFHVTSSLIMPARKTWSCDFNYDGRPGSIMLYPSDQDKAKMTVDLIYELPAHLDASMMEPREEFDIEGPGEMAQQAPNPNPQQ